MRAGSSRVRLSAGLVLLVSALAWLLARSISGWIAAAAWCGLLLIPAWRRHRWRAARYPSRPFAIRLSPAVAAILVLNIAAFAAEIILGGPSDGRALDRLGWLDTDSVIYAHQYWRLLSALFLHYGAVHLIVNMFALLILGPALEREIGGIAFIICYLLSGLGSSLTVVLLAKWRPLSAVQLVGASGCIMGVVGVWAGVLLRYRHLPIAAQRLRNIIMIVALQIIFDLITPRVSMSAHLGGLTTGFLLGLFIRPSGRNEVYF